MSLKGIPERDLRGVVGEVPDVQLGVSVGVDAATTATATAVLTGLGEGDGDCPAVKLRLVHGFDGPFGHGAPAGQGHEGKAPHSTGVTVCRDVDICDVPAELTKFLSECIFGGVEANVANI